MGVTWYDVTMMNEGTATKGANEMQTATETSGRYVVKCDECKKDMRHTDSMVESAAGGRCEECRSEPADT
jgi:hypothetical protein